MARAVLDATGLLCPLPVLKARKAMKGLAAGDVLELRATDPGAEQDLAAFCQTTGNELVATRREGEALVFEIRKSSA